MIVQDVSRPNNVQGRVATSFRDGQYTRYVEVIQGSINIYASDVDAQGNPVLLRQNDELAGRDMQVTNIEAHRSGVDGNLLVTVGGFTPGTTNSRRITVKFNWTVLEPWEAYP